MPNAGMHIRRNYYQTPSTHTTSNCTTHWKVFWTNRRLIPSFRCTKTSPWSSGRCVDFCDDRWRDCLSSGSCQDLVNWYCSLLSRRTMYGRAAWNTLRTQKGTGWNESRNCTNPVVALQDNCNCKAPTTDQHLKKRCTTGPWGQKSLMWNLRIIH